MARRLAHFNDPKLEAQIQELIEASNALQVQINNLLDEVGIEPHADTHAIGGIDPVTPISIGAATSSHDHTWADIASGVPATATRWPSWSEVTSKPSTFTPSSHNHVVSEVDGAETPGGAQAKVDAHANESSVHSATSVVTANRIIIRDTSGRAEIAIPTKSNEIANKAYVDALQSDLVAHKDATAPHSGHATTTTLNSHTRNKQNPHAVTAAQIPYASTVEGFEPALVSGALDVLAGSRIVDHNLDVADPPNGYYARWDNGLQICWHILEGTNTDPTYTAWHVEEGFVEWTTPASFVDELLVLAFASSPGWHTSMLSSVLDTDTATIRRGPTYTTYTRQIIPYRVLVYQDGRIYVRAFAVGRWK